MHCLVLWGTQKWKLCTLPFSCLYYTRRDRPEDKWLCWHIDKGADLLTKHNQDLTLESLHTCSYDFAPREPRAPRIPESAGIQSWGILNKMTWCWTFQGPATISPKVGWISLCPAPKWKLKSDLMEALKTSFPKCSSLSRSHVCVSCILCDLGAPFSSYFDLWFREQFVRRHEIFLGTALSCSLLIFM